MAEPTIEQQSVTISFNTKDYVPATYVFEMDDRTDVDQTQYGVVRIRKYPAPLPGLSGLFGSSLAADMGINIVVTEGSLEFTSETRERDVSGATVVSGAAEVSLPYPVVRNLSYYIDGKAYDKYGIERTVTIGYDSKANKLVLSRPCYCKVQFSFDTSYQILRYKPNIFNDYEIYYMPDPADYGQLLGFVKTPAIFEPEPPIVFAITPPEGISAEFELYRVESLALAKEDGLWEKPMGWPKSGDYPVSEETLDSNESYIEVARTHEIGYFSLFNNPRRMESLQSSPMESLPLDFSKELTYAAQAGGVIGRTTQVTSGDGKAIAALRRVVKIQGKEHFDKYKRLLNRAPKMRTVHYDVPVAEPYNSESAINEAREVVRTLATQVIINNEGDQQKRHTIVESIDKFRIKLVVKAPSRPSISTAVLRDRNNAGSTDLNTQALRINTMLSLIWEGIDWGHLRKRILAAYSPDIYEVSFDSSFPGTEKKKEEGGGAAIVPVW